MHKGQIFSIDFIIAMGIVVLLIGSVMLAAEKQNFDRTEQNAQNRLITKTSSGITALLASAEYDCNIENQLIPSSLDINKLMQKKDKIKENIGLTDYNVQLTIDTGLITQIIYDEEKGKNIYSIDFNVLTCIDSNKLSFVDFFDCKDGTCYSNNLKERKVTIRVGK